MNLSSFLQQVFYNTKSVFNVIPPQVFWFMVGMGGLFILYFMYQSYKGLKRARVIEDTPTAKIRSVAQGYAELLGEQYILANSPSATKLSRLPCTWHRYAIEFRDQQSGWRVIEHGNSAALFGLKDGTGVCIIDPKGAEISTPMVDQWQGFNRYPNGKPRSWLGRFWGARGKYRYTEWTMHEGMPLHAMGNFHTYSLQPFKVLYPKYEWASDDDSINLLSKSGLDKQNPFVLSAIDQKKSIRKYRIDAFIWFIAYMSLLAGIGWLLVARLP